MLDKVSATKRMLVCQNCEKFKPSTQQCSLCSCVMPLKVWLPNAKCPQDKWTEQISMIDE